MELIGMLRHFASWNFLIVIATLDVFFILLQISGPSPGVPSLLPTLRPSHPRSEDAKHAELLQRVHEERVRLGEEMKRRVREMRSITRTLQLRAEVLHSLNDSIGRLEDSILWLKEDDERGGVEGVGSVRRVRVDSSRPGSDGD
ncbi:uncharacterized protein [Littorina saxatilis]|uniref:uncharacterized protein n=1 Tax=Littorina saxatilis TaxID=31220 RepID=UPI0038B6292C